MEMIRVVSRKGFNFSPWRKGDIIIVKSIYNRDNITMVEDINGKKHILNNLMPFKQKKKESIGMKILKTIVESTLIPLGKE